MRTNRTRDVGPGRYSRVGALSAARNPTTEVEQMSNPDEHVGASGPVAEPGPAGQPDQPGNVAYPPPGGYAPGTYPPPPGGYAPGSYPPPPAGALPVAAAPGAGDRASAFAGVPLRDYLTDGIALLLLLVSLGLGWDYRYASTDRVEVVLLVVLSVLSLSLFYLARVNALPRGWSNRTVIGVRALVNAPLVVLVLVYLAFDVLAAFLDRGLGSWMPSGIGPAMAIALAGAVVAASPRVAELGSARTVDLVTAWTRRTLVALVVLAGALQLAGVVAVLVQLVDRFSWAIALIELVTFVVATAIVVAPLVAVLRQSAAWRRVLVAVASTATFAFVLYGPLHHEEPGLGYHAATSVTQLTAGFVVLPAAGVLMLAAGWRRLVRPVVPLERDWFASASAGWVALAVLAGGAAIVQLVTVIASTSGLEVGGIGWRVVLVVVLAFTAVAAVVARSLFAAGPATGRAPALVATCVATVLGVVALVVAVRPHGFWRGSAELPELLLAFGLPLLVGSCLLLPAPVRSWYATHGPGPRQPWSDDELPGGAPAAPTPAHAPAPAAPAPGPVAGAPAPAAAVPPVVVEPIAAPPADLQVSAQVAPVPTDPVPTDPAPIDPTPIDPAPLDPAPTVAAEPVSAEPVSAEPVAAERGAAEPGSAESGTGQPEAAPAAQGESSWFDEYSAAQESADDTRAPAEPAHGFTAAQAADPATDLEVLAAIAAQAPELRVHLASNPSTYPDLVAWLGRLGDPEIDAALARRGS